ncbi:glutamine synthetase, partial [Francisella tularensis subsp. holarctica]|nr:glutamine synthetase [Francisella tularensis subsp. holarctica]
MKVITAEYIWAVGSDPVPHLRSKARVLPFKEFETPDVFPEWSGDGSSSNQATGDNSECLLKPGNF